MQPIFHGIISDGSTVRDFVVGIGKGGLNSNKITKGIIRLRRVDCTSIYISHGGLSSGLIRFLCNLYLKYLSSAIKKIILKDIMNNKTLESSF